MILKRSETSQHHISHKHHIKYGKFQEVSAIALEKLRTTKTEEVGNSPGDWYTDRVFADPDICATTS